jgi:DtxR family Mn-dependent transcriptional regulator
VELPGELSAQISRGMPAICQNELPEYQNMLKWNRSFLKHIGVGIFWRKDEDSNMTRAEENNGVQKTTEDYLEAILIIKERQGYVRSSDVADQLQVARPSVTYTTKRLKEKGMITTDHAGMLVLTKEGAQIAETTYEKHEKVADLLQRLGVSADQAYVDSCKIEHDLSDESFKALCKLFNPSKKTIAALSKK